MIKYPKLVVEKYILFCILLFGSVSLPSCQNGGSNKNSNNNQLNVYDTVSSGGPVIQFDTTTYDFGRVYEGEMVGWYFKYKNIGSKNLLLKNVTAGCGCTTPEYSGEPLVPGGVGRIKIVFDTKGRSGYQYKTVSVESNGDPSIIELVITAEIIGKK